MNLSCVYFDILFQTDGSSNLFQFSLTKSWSHLKKEKKKKKIADQCVRACVRACVRVCVCVLNIVMLEHLVMSTLCVRFCKLREPFCHLDVHYMCHICSALWSHGVGALQVSMIIIIISDRIPF